MKGGKGYHILGNSTKTEKTKSELGSAQTDAGQAAVGRKFLQRGIRLGGPYQGGFFPRRVELGAMQVHV